LLGYAGLELCSSSRRTQTNSQYLTDLEPWVSSIIEKVRPFTMTSKERISALCDAVKYVTNMNIPGEMVECGVWRGGSVMAAALTLLRFQDFSRTFYLFDTFEGMPPPRDIDRALASGIQASILLEKANKSEAIWAYSPMDEVRVNVVSTGYPPSQFQFIKGRVEDTLPARAPAQISLLRLDTDWYESTRHELTHLFPRLVPGGVLIIDDYGHWEGARRAVDEYFDAQRIPILLTRIDYTGRIGIKLGCSKRRC